MLHKFSKFNWCDEGSLVINILPRYATVYCSTNFVLFESINTCIVYMDLLHVTHLLSEPITLTLSSALFVFVCSRWTQALDEPLVYLLICFMMQCDYNSVRCAWIGTKPAWA